MTDKPLHVQVAEALRCKVVERTAPHPNYPGKIEGPIIAWECGCAENGHWLADEMADSTYDASILRYDILWSATGPLIEKYKIMIGGPDHEVLRAASGEWYAYGEPIAEGEIPEGHGETPLIAVCNLILALAEAGKLAA